MTLFWMEPNSPRGLKDRSWLTATCPQITAEVSCGKVDFTLLIWECSHTHTHTLQLPWEDQTGVALALHFSKINFHFMKIQLFFFFRRKHFDVSLCNDEAILKTDAQAATVFVTLYWIVGEACKQVCISPLKVHFAKTVPRNTEAVWFHTVLAVLSQHYPQINSLFRESGPHAFLLIFKSGCFGGRLN